MLRLFPQRTDGDCSIACLATYLGRPYSTILKTAKRYSRDPVKLGMFMTEIQKVAKKLGCSLVLKRHINFANHEGILSVDNYAKGWRRRGKGKEPEGHVVVLWRGLIYDPTCGGTLWTVEQYKRCNKTKFTSILRR